MANQVLSVIALFRDTVDRQPDAPAYEDLQTNHSFQQIWDMSRNAQALLQERGVEVGSRVVLLLDDNVTNLAALLGVWMCGAVVVPVNTAQSTDKLVFILNQIQADLVLLAPNKSVPPGIENGNCLAWPDRLDDKEPLQDVRIVDPRDDAMILYTSGTTGVPKGVLHSQKALTLNAIEMSDLLQLSPSDRLFLNIPFCFSNTVSHLLMALFRGACIVSRSGFLLGDALIEQVKSSKATGFGGVPAHYVRIADIATGPIENDLRFIMNSGDHLPIDVLKRLQVVFPKAEIFCAYGISECAPRVCCLPPDRLTDKLGSVGPPLPATSVTVRDEDAELVPAGELGEVYVRSECLMKEYFANPQATAKSMTPHGFRTGDMGYLDEEGFLFLTGRNDSVFKSGGEKVSCRLIEETVRESEHFADLMSDAVVLAVDDHYLGKVPCLYYVHREGSDKQISLLKRELRATLPRNHMPAKFLQVKSVNRSPSGKVIKTALQDPSNFI